MAREILVFETSWKHDDLGFWFAIYADRIGKKGTYDFIKDKFKEHEWTWECMDDNVPDQPYEFSRSDYKELKKFVVSSQMEEWRPEAPKGIEGGGYLFPLCYEVKKITIADI